MSYLVEWTTSTGKKKSQEADNRKELNTMINYLDKGIEKGTITGYLITSI